ncbi:MAG: AAA family ATPase [Bacteroidetes bacterium]|nr:AAA family ATPase [Bacteroidota bacterium]
MQGTTNENREASIASKFINNTNKNVFLTGKAGTGKTTFLKYIIKHTYKNTVIAAPTGIAAINAGGVTLHSLFQLPFGAFIPDRNANANFTENSKINTPTTLFKQLQLNSTKRKLIQELELLIIDEVSMLRADLLDAMDTVLRSVRRKNAIPFGGVQVLFIGDMLQLPPVVKMTNGII